MPTVKLVFSFANTALNPIASLNDTLFLGLVAFFCAILVFRFLLGI